MQRILFFVLCILYSIVIFLNGSEPSFIEDQKISKSKEIISSHKAVFTESPQKVPSFKSVDGPITGNGDIGLTLSGNPSCQKYWISKNDFWK